MFLQNAKKVKECAHCHGQIERGEIFCIVKMPKLEGNSVWLSFYHYRCWIPHMEESLQKKYDNFTGRGIDRPRMGRPMVKTTDRAKRRKLLSLRAYHTKHGHPQEVQRVQEMIDAITVKEEPCVTDAKI